jgi:hypothetical protein
MTKVFVLDYGRHSSLVIPSESGDFLIEYAYGEWNWFALRKNRWHHVFLTLFFPTRGALGRRAFRARADTQAVRRACFAEAVLEVIVEESNVGNLERRLEAEFEAHRETLHYQPEFGLHFVHSDRDFHLFHNCNHSVSEWLREMGCEVQGPSMFADFKLKPPAR